MKISESLGLILLGLWLIILNLQNLLHRTFPVISTLLPILAIVAGVLLLLATAKIGKSLGGVLLACWLILKGIWIFLPMPLAQFGPVLHALGLVAGVVLLVKK